MFRTLLVEDSIPFRDLFKIELLSQFPSMEVMEAGSGEEAVKKLASCPADLIFMDIGLPGQSGLEATKRIKADHQDITIAILTTYNLPEYKEAAIKCGASCFIAKESFEWEEIFTFLKCFQGAKHNGRKPACIRIISGCE